MNKKIIMAVGVGLLALIMIIAITGFQVRHNMISSSMGIGNYAMSQGDFEEAIAAYNNVIKIDQGNTEVRLNLGKAYIGAKQYDNAEQTFLDAIAFDKKNKSVYEKLLEGLKVKTPKANLESGKYDEDKTVEIVQINEGDKVFYTADGTKPTEKSTLYSEPIKLKDGKYELHFIAINKLGISSAEAKYEYDISIDLMKKFLKLLETGKVEELSFGLGDNIADVRKSMGEPGWQGYFSGGMWYSYKEVSFITAEEDGIITAISFNRGTSLYGIKVGDTITKVMSVLGAGPKIIRSDPIFDEIANTGDTTTMTYASGKYELIFHCDPVKTTGAMISAVKE